MKTLSKTAQAYILARGVDPQHRLVISSQSVVMLISLANRLRSEVSMVLAQLFECLRCT